MKKAFTLIEMLVVIGIITILAAATASGVAKMLRVADRVRCQELVSNTSTALLALFQQNGSWPKGLMEGRNETNDELDERAARALAQGNYLSLHAERVAGQVVRLKGYDRFGVVSPWATTTIKRAGTKNISLETRVSSGGTIKDHILHYALDRDGDGILEAEVGGERVKMRANVAVWCCGKDGKMEPYSHGDRHDDVYSWVVGQTRGVNR